MHSNVLTIPNRLQVVSLTAMRSGVHDKSHVICAEFYKLGKDDAFALNLKSKGPRVFKTGNIRTKKPRMSSDFQLFYIVRIVILKEAIDKTNPLRSLS